MTFDLTLDEGTYLVKLARRKIETCFTQSEFDIKDAPIKISEVCGVFVTLNKFIGAEKQLRGCIGYPYPIKPLIEAVCDVAEAAAFDDYRFPRLVKNELKEIILEVSVLTPPERVIVDRPDQYPSMINIGVDGLIVKRGSRSGLLLPQVATEWGWDSDEFLSQCCVKAGFPLDSWLLPGIEVSRFQAIIFTELTPNGKVVRENLQD